MRILVQITQLIYIMFGQLRQKFKKNKWPFCSAQAPYGPFKPLLRYN